MISIQLNPASRAYYDRKRAEGKRHSQAVLALALAGAVAGAVAELGSTRLDDNFTIPLTTAIAVTAMQLFL